jgi:hypothetical protein
MVRSWSVFPASRSRHGAGHPSPAPRRPLGWVSACRHGSGADGRVPARCPRGTPKTLRGRGRANGQTFPRRRREGNGWRSEAGGAP